MSWRRHLCSSPEAVEALLCGARRQGERKTPEIQGEHISLAWRCPAEEQTTLGWEGETGAAQQERSEGPTEVGEIREAGAEVSEEKGQIGPTATRRVIWGG